MGEFETHSLDHSAFLTIQSFSGPWSSNTKGQYPPDPFPRVGPVLGFLTTRPFPLLHQTLPSSPLLSVFLLLERGLCLVLWFPKRPPLPQACIFQDVKAPRLLLHPSLTPAQERKQGNGRVAHSSLIPLTSPRGVYPAPFLGGRTWWRTWWSTGRIGRTCTVLGNIHLLTAGSAISRRVWGPTDYQDTAFANLV